jgi:tetratricopeptide (TPR) repeat protein
VEWGEAAAEAFPEDTSVTAQLVESYLGLRRMDEAARLLPERGAAVADYYLAVGRGRLLAQQGAIDEAVRDFETAAALAGAQRVTELQVWAHVAAAGVLIDAGRALDAAPHLDAAASLLPRDVGLRIHQAEFLEASGRLAEAGAAYEALLREVPNPDLHARAFRVARRLGREAAAAEHFRGAERGFQRAIDAGEVYTIEALNALKREAEGR